MQNLKKYKLPAISAALFIFTGIRAQVTIGIDEKPVKAALLELKTMSADADNATSTKGGLVLPRVKLTAKDNLTPFIKTSDPEWQTSTQDKTKAAHVGLTVYNMTTDSYFKPGTYVWDGKIWIPVFEPANKWFLKGNSGTTSAKNFIGTKDSVALSIKTNGTERISISETGEITAKNNLKITGKSTINGIVYMNNVPVATSDKVSQIAIDSVGRVCKVQAASGNTKMFNYLKYKIHNVNGDWIKDFNTKIPANQYTLIVVGSTFTTQNETDVLSTSSGKGYNPQEVYAKTDGGTWRLVADYKGGSPKNTNGVITNGTWEIDCIAINNAVVQTISSSLTFNLGGQNSGTSQNIPSGL